MKLKNVEDIYPLSPMQQGMLFHSLYAPDSGQYFQQVSCTLEGELHIPTFELAWQRVAQRYPALRTAFFWEGLQEPLQVVRQQLAIDFRHYDWREFLGSDRQEKLERLLQTDRQSGFHLAQAPLMRFHLIRHQEQSYRLIWSYHHILLDGWCLSPILNDVFSLYDALCRGDNLHLPSVRPYRDYIQWLQQQETTSSERFWTNYLADFNAPTPLPHCGKQGVFQEEQPGPAYQEQQFQVSQDITRRLQRLAQQQRATLNVIMQAAWAILLSRYSGETDVVFGATVSGRPAALTGVEGMVGLFINTLPIRIQLASDLSLNALLQQIQARQFDVESYSYTALVDIQGWSDLPSGAALFESLLLFENFPVEKMAQGRNGLRVKDFRFDERTNYPLTIMIEPGAELSIKVSYDRSRFDAATITRMLQHVHVLLASIATHPERPVSRLPLLTDAEQRQLVTEWNQTKTEYPADSCFYHLFEDRAKQFPGALAVICDDERLTYQELNTRANQLAHYLRTLQIGPDTLVGLCLERSPDMIVGLLGILKAGGAYVPLDPAFPEDRLAYMLEDAGVSVLVTQESLQSKFHVPHRLCLDRDWDAISQERQDNPMNGAISDNPAYVIYTSGSTGKPKGVQIGHQSLVNFLHSMRVEPGLTNQDCLLAVTTISFDIAALELYLPLITGAGIILAGREQATDGLQLAQLLTHNDVTVMQATPATWRMLLAAGWEGKQNLKILCGGEALPKDLSNDLSYLAEC